MFAHARVDGALAASVFHKGVIAIPDLKRYLADEGIVVRHMSAIDIEKLDWAKDGGLIPAIVQDAETQRVLMLGYMNREALAATLRSGLVTFYSRSKQRLWQKGETSGHTLKLVSVAPDCDSDALLVLVQPLGPTCHRGTTSCFGEDTPRR